MRNQGQIAIITLFSLAVFVVISGSIVTQIVFEQKKAVLEEKSRQAYYAAESGIENALQEIIESGEVGTSTLQVGDAGVDIVTESGGGGTTFEVPNQLYPGDSYYLNLSGYTSNQLRICWDKSETGIVASYFYNNASNFLRTNTYAINSQGSNNISGATGSLTAVNGCNLEGTVYYTDLSLPVGTPAYLLVWVAYQDGVQVAFEALGGSTFIAQNTIITSTAEVTENQETVARELKYSVSRTSSGSLTYPPAWLTVPIFAEGGISYGE